MKLTKLLALVMALVMVLAMAACGKTEEAPIVTRSPEDVTEAPTEEVTEVPTEEATEAPTEAPAENALALGTIEGSTYTNTYGGFAIDFDENWTLSGASELQNLTDAVVGAVSETDLGAALAEYTQFTDMYAQSLVDISNVNVVYQEIDLSQKLNLATMSDDEIIDMMLDNKQLLLDTYAQMNFEIKSIDKTTAQFLGKERAVLQTNMVVGGVEMVLLQVLDYSLGDYFLSITATAGTADAAMDILEMFYEI